MLIRNKHKKLESINSSHTVVSTITATRFTMRIMDIMYPNLVLRMKAFNFSEKGE